MNSNAEPRRGWVTPGGLALTLLLLGVHFASAPTFVATNAAPPTPWTLVAPLALLVLGSGRRLFPGTLPRALAPRAGFISDLDWAGVTLQPNQRCPYCHEGLSKRDDLSRCGECHTVYHLACAREGHSCATLGCKNFRSFV